MTFQGKFWPGVTLGIVIGTFAVSKILQKKRMPNAKIWQHLLAERSDEIEAAIQMAQVEKRYEHLYHHRPIFANQALNSHVETNILPGLAVYQTFQQAGWNREKALIEIDALFKDWFMRFPPAQIRITQLMNFVPKNFTFFRRAVHFMMEKHYPSPAWQVKYIFDNDQVLAFHIERCFYKDIMTHYNAPELTASFCKLDDYSMAMLPKTIRWGRTQTLGMGADFCDYRWDFCPREDSTHCQDAPIGAD